MASLQTLLWGSVPSSPCTRCLEVFFSGFPWEGVLCSGWETHAVWHAACWVEQLSGESKRKYLVKWKKMTSESRATGLLHMAGQGWEKGVGREEALAW